MRFGGVVMLALLLSLVLVDGGNFGECSIYLSRMLGTFPSTAQPGVLCAEQRHAVYAHRHRQHLFPGM